MAEDTSYEWKPVKVSLSPGCSGGESFENRQKTFLCGVKGGNLWMR